MNESEMSLETEKQKTEVKAKTWLLAATTTIEKKFWLAAAESPQPKCRQ